MFNHLAYEVAQYLDVLHRDEERLVTARSWVVSPQFLDGLVCLLQNVLPFIKECGGRTEKGM
jgi:hypothetical protein